MTDWFRSWHGAPTDPKWLGIAKKAGVAPGIVAAVAWALMDRASQSDDRGSIEGYDADGLSCFFGCEPEQVDSIVRAMTEKGMVVEGRFAAWEKRQPRREDDSAQRVREHRERAREHQKRDVTHRNAPETDTEADKIDKPQAQHPRPARSRAELDEIERVCREAGGFRTDPSPGFLNTSVLVGLIDAGCDLQLDLVSTIRQLSAKARRRPTSWEYFRDAALENAGRRRDLAAAGIPAVAPSQTGPPRVEKPTLAAAFGQLATEMRQQREIRSGASDSGVQPPILDLPAIRHG